MVELKGDSKSSFVSQLFKGIATQYDLMNTMMTMGRHRYWRRKSVDYIVGSGNVLDLATGTGDFVLELLGKSKANYVVGLDITPAMLDVASKKIADKNLSNHVSLIVGDAHNLPFRDGSFDYVTVGFGVRNFQNLPIAINEIKRVISPNGKLIILEIVKPEGWFMSNVFPVFFGILAPILGIVFARNKNAYIYLTKSVEGFVGISELAEIIQNNGFTEIKTYRYGCGSIGVMVAGK